MPRNLEDALLESSAIVLRAGSRASAAPSAVSLARIVFSSGVAFLAGGGNALPPPPALRRVSWEVPVGVVSVGLALFWTWVFIWRDEDD